MRKLEIKESQEGESIFFFLILRRETLFLALYLIIGLVLIGEIYRHHCRCINFSQQLSRISKRDGTDLSADFLPASIHHLLRDVQLMHKTCVLDEEMVLSPAHQCSSHSINNLGFSSIAG